MIEKFSIKRFECRCSICKSKFVIDNSADNELVKFYFDNELNPRWIKMYGERGYLSLIEKLVEKGASNLISMDTINILESKINELLKKRVIFDTGIRECPSCGSKEISIINESIFESDEIDLFEIDN